MTTRSRSISYKLTRTNNPKRKAEILHDWANRWRQEHVSLIERLKDGIDTQNMAEILISLGQLRAVTEKKHDALHNIFDCLLSASEKKDCV